MAVAVIGRGIEEIDAEIERAVDGGDAFVVVLGAVSDWKPSPLDRGYTFKTMVARVRAGMATPLLTGLPFGHVNPKVTLPVGRQVELLVQGRDVLVAW